MVDLRAVVHVSWGLWCARCPVPGCPNAEHFGPHPDTGHVGKLTGTTFRCSHCSWAGAADWPPNVNDINYLLSLRPVPATRNWHPPETVHDLLTENLAHGIMPGPRELVEAAPDGLLLEVRGDHITGGVALPTGGARPALEGVA